METKDKGNKLKETEKKSGVKFGTILIIVFLIVYVPSFIHWVYGRSVATGIIQIGVIEDSVNTDGVLVRDEEVLQSPFSGVCIPAVNEGEKIPVHFNVATVMSKSSEKLLTELKEKDIRIIKTQQEKSANKSVFTEDLDKLDGEITDKLKLVIDAGNSNSLGMVSQLKTDIDGLVQKKTAIVGGSDSSDTYVKSLKNEKQELQKMIKQNTREIISPSSGIISYMVDGYEDILRPDAIKDFTPQFLGGIKVEQAAGNADGRNVEADKPFAKVIKGVDCYIVISLDENKADRFKPGDMVRLRINDIGKTIEGTVDYKSPKTEEKYILSIRIDQGISETAGMRKLNIDLITKYHEGYKVPLSSLRNLNTNDKKAEIVLVKANYATIRKVEILGTDTEYAIIGGLDDSNPVDLYDMFVLRPQNIKEGQYINQ